MDVAAEIAGLKREVAAMATGLSALAEAQNIQTEILRALLEAATGDSGSEPSLTDAIRELAGAVERQSEELAALRMDVAGLPSAITGAGRR